MCVFCHRTYLMLITKISSVNSIPWCPKWHCPDLSTSFLEMWSSKLVFHPVPYTCRPHMQDDVQSTVSSRPAWVIYSETKSDPVSVLREKSLNVIMSPWWKIKLCLLDSSSWRSHISSASLLSTLQLWPTASSTPHCVWILRYLLILLRFASVLCLWSEISHLLSGSLYLISKALLTDGPCSFSIYHIDTIILFVFILLWTKAVRHLKSALGKLNTAGLHGRFEGVACVAPACGSTFLLRTSIQSHSDTNNLMFRQDINTGKERWLYSLTPKVSGCWNVKY